jgi:diguanylate cyclase (GGDEF)-like protein
MENLKSIIAKKSEKYYVIALIAVLLIIATLISSNGRVSWPVIPTFIAMCGILIFVTSLQTAFLLYNQSKLTQDSSVALLASGYLAVSFLALARIILFPGLFLSSSILDDNNQIAAWLWVITHITFPFFLILYAMNHWKKMFFSYRYARWSFRLIPLAVLLLVLSLVYYERALPSLVDKGNYSSTSYIDFFLLAFTAVPLFLLMTKKEMTNRQDLWLMLAITVQCLDIFYEIIGETRYSMGWYLGMISSIVSSSIILGVFIYHILCIAQLKDEEGHYFKDISETDPLTGVANRRKLDLVFNTLWELSLNQQQPLCLIMIDIDHFKTYNDSYGHLEGDKCLIKVADALSKIPKRSTDIVARIGGEEFVILLYGVDHDVGLQVAEEVRKEIENLHISHSTFYNSWLTVSIGYASHIVKPSSKKEKFLYIVDQALYRSKADGRNRVEGVNLESIFQ